MRVASRRPSALRSLATALGSTLSTVGRPAQTRSNSSSLVTTSPTWRSSSPAPAAACAPAPPASPPDDQLEAGDLVELDGAEAVAVQRFSLTDAGRKAITPENHFCYGRAEVVEVVDYTQPADVNGVATVQAEARLRRRIDADWAKHPAVAELTAAGDDTVSMLLVKKAKGGWSPAY
jgi:hypothetical protein